MKYYAQFYNYDVPGTWNNYKPELSEACGSDSVHLLDARFRLDNLIDQVKSLPIVKFKKHYKAFKIMRGNNFRDKGHPLTDLIMINQIED